MSIVRLSRIITIYFVLGLSRLITTAQTPVINTVVGGLDTTAGYGPATSWGITPNGVAADATVGASVPTGNVYFSDAIHQVVWAVNVATGTMFPLAGDGAFGNTTTLVHPTALAVDTNGNLYIADVSVVYKVSTSGGPMTVFAGCLTLSNLYSKCPAPPNIGDGGPATSALVSPEAISVDSAGNVFIADAVCAIRRVDAHTGIITTVAGTPHYCGDSGDGGPATSAPISSSGVYVDKANNIFIAGGFVCSIREVSAATGIIQTIAGTYPTCDSSGNSTGPGGPTGPATTTPLFQPQSIAVDGSGLVYIQEPYRLRVVNTSPNAITIQGYTINPGDIWTIAGTGIPGFSPCSPSFCDPTGVAGLQDPLNNASAVAVVGSGPDSAGVVNDVMLIADTSNDRVRSLLGNVSPFAACSGGICPPQTFFPSVAGNGLPDSIPDGYSALGGFPLSQVGGLSEDAASNLYLTLMANPRVLQVYPAGNSTKVKTIAGNGLSGLPGQGNGNAALSAELQRPSSVFLDALDELIITDYSQVRAINPTSTQQSLYGPTIFPGDIQSIMSFPGYYSASILDGPTLLAALNSQAVLPLVCDQEQIIDASGQSVVGKPCNQLLNGSYPYSSSTVGDNGPLDGVSFANVSGMCVDSSSNLYIADSGNIAASGTYTLRVVNFGLSPITVANTAIQPQSINTVAGGGGTIPTFPADPFSHFLYTSAQLGDGGPATSALITPFGCYVDGNGNIFIADYFNDRIRRIDNKAGTIATVAGSQYPGFSGDGGPPANASLNYPNSIWGDQAGNLFISDSGNNRVREISGLLPVPIASISCQVQDPNVLSCSNLSNSSSTSSIAVVKVQNTGAAPLILSRAPLLSDSTDFSIASSESPCPVGPPGLQPQAFCNITVSVAATASPSASTNLVVADNAYWSNMNSSSGPTPDPNHSGQLSGYLQSTPITFTFINPIASVGPATLIFTGVNSPQSVTISNTGPVALPVTTLTLPSFVTLTANGTTCATIPFTLPPGQTGQPVECVENIAFNPPSSGGGAASYSGNVTIGFGTSIPSQNIPIVGYALVPSGQTSFNISNSAPSPVTAAFNLIGVGSTTFTPVCVITPAGLDVSCTYSASNQSVTATISIPSCIPSKASIFGGSSLMGYLLMAVGFGVCFLSLRVQHRQQVLAVFAVVLVCYIGTGLSGCSTTNNISSSCVASVSPGTTFNLNVTATSTSGQVPSLALPSPDQITVTQ